MLSLVIVFLLAPLYVYTLIWLAALLSVNGSSSGYGFVSYKKFKKYFNSEEWEAPSYHTNKVLIKGDFDLNRMCSDSATFIYEGKTMLPSSPYSYFMICRLVDKTVDSKKPKQPKRKIKW